MSHATSLPALGAALVIALLLSVVVASIAWTVTHEEIAREFREWCQARHRRSRNVWAQKIFYVFTCEYCFSHWVTLGVLAATNFRLAYDDWRGLLVAFFVVVWLANHAMGLYARLKLDIKSERLDIKAKEDEVSL